jgi:tetratricopeptide (TPR) repeat protein
MLFHNQKVITPYGPGLYIGPHPSNEDILIVKPSGWIMNMGTIPTFYMNSKDVQPLYIVGSKVYLTYGGEGIITDYRPDDNIYIVTLLHWKLAQGQSPTLYVQESNLSQNPIIRKNNIIKETEPQIPYAESSIAKAIAIKEEAGLFYKQGDIESAKNNYLKALEAMQYLGESLTNQQKAIVFEQTVPCHNNISLCCLLLKNYPESVQFAKNGILLISAIEERMETGLVWKCLLERGMTQNKLLKEWKKKSYFLAGKAELLNKEYKNAIIHLENAIKLIDGDVQSAAEILKLKDLLKSAMKKKSAELKREKDTWAKAFQKNKIEPDEIVAPAAVGSGEVSDVKTESIETIMKDLHDNTSRVKDEVEESGGDDSVSDEMFGYAVGASLVLGVIGLVTFAFLRSRQK